MNDSYCITEKIKDKRIQRLKKLMKKSEVIKVEKNEDRYCIYFQDGQILKTSGFIIDNCIDTIEKNKVMEKPFKLL